VSSALVGQLVEFEPLRGLRHRIWYDDVSLGELEFMQETCRAVTTRVSAMFCPGPSHKKKH